MGKIHGGLAKVGKVRAATPKVPKQVRTKKRVTGRAKARKLYERRFRQTTEHQQNLKKPNYNSQKEQIKMKKTIVQNN